MSRIAMYKAVGITALASWVLSCAAQQPRVDHSAAVTETAPEVETVSAAPECVNDKDQPVECLADTDCCQGFVCGKDPELSQRVSYCIYGG